MTSLTKNITLRSLMGLAGLLLLQAVLSMGVYWSFTRGAPDFEVYFAAGKLVSEKRFSDLYFVSPDRYLYVPIFAWFFSMLQYLGREGALLVWNILKLTSIASTCFVWVRVVKEIRVQGQNPFSVSWVEWCEDLAAPVWAWIFVARPVLIDFSYGQVNIIAVSLLWIAFLSWLSPVKIGWVKNLFLSFLVSFVAWIKILALPVLGLSFLNKNEKGKLSFNVALFILILFCSFIVLLLPGLFVGWEGLKQLYFDWFLALKSKGFPPESHNQSFQMAIRYLLGGEGTPIIALDGARLQIPFQILDGVQLKWMEFAWQFFMAGAIARLLLSGTEKIEQKILNGSLILGIAILPSYLIWKSYFVFGVPALCFLLSSKKNLFLKLLAASLAFVINFSSLDFIGTWLSAHFEAARIFLWVHLLWLLMARRSVRSIRLN